MDQIPKFSFFSFHDAVEYVRDCMDRVKYRSSGAWHSRNWGAQNWSSGGSRTGGAGYGGLRSTPEEAETMLGGPPGWLDEQDDEDEEEEAARHAPEPPQGSQPEGRRPGMDEGGVIRL